MKRPCLYVVSVNPFTVCSSPEIKCEFWDVSRIPKAWIQRTSYSSLLISTSKLVAVTEQLIGGPFSVLADSTDNGGRSIEVCFDHKLFPVNINFRHKKRRRLTWCFSSASER